MPLAYEDEKEDFKMDDNQLARTGPWVATWRH